MSPIARSLFRSALLFGALALGGCAGGGGNCTIPMVWTIGSFTTQ